LETLNWLLNILTVAVGLGFVIFFHELGHFLMAKWNGVKVEKFAIGFDPYGLKLYSFRKGETEYVLGAIPLGGYVKMLGEGTDDQAEAIVDPRAYSNKSVGARMQIISAGVLMNLILGFACFVFADLWGGVSRTPAKLGMVVAGLPAYRAGIRTGDEIVGIDGQRNVSFEDLLRTVALSGKGQVVHLDLKRPGRDDLISIQVEPRREASAERPTVGINPSFGLELMSDEPYQAPPATEGKLEGRFEKGDRIVRVGPVGETPEPVTDEMDLDRILAKFPKKPLTVVVERGAGRKAPRGATPQTVSVTVPPHHFLDFGFRLRIGPLAAVQGGSIAEKAGFQKGDIILKVDGKSDFDPMFLPTYIYEHAGTPVTFEVERRHEDGPPQTVTITATPDATPAWTERILQSEPLEVPGLGLAYRVGPKIAAVKEGSPAAKAGLKAGGRIGSLTVTIPQGEGRKKKDHTYHFTEQDSIWPFVFTALQDPANYFEYPPEPTVQVTIDDLTKPISLTPEPDPSWYHPLRGFRLDYLKRPIPPQGLAAALRHGLEETIENVTSIYYMLRGLAQSRLGKENFGGPIRIAGLAYQFADSGLSPFVFFLGLLSVNLAVLNFLPIPPLDGGQMAFLIAEKIRGRPLPESALSAGTLAGLVLVLGLMAFFIYQDVLLSFFS
jgi:regulator of sigma E protease